MFGLFSGLSIKEEKEDDEIIHLKKQKLGNSSKQLRICKVCALEERNNLLSNVHNIQKSVGSDEFIAQLRRCGSGMR